ncbi:thiamine phosphate synthase [Luteococcus peritonei]
MGLTGRLRVAKLHLITDVRSEQGDFRDFVVAALRGGVDMLQVRDARAGEDELLEALEIARSAANQVNATVVVGRNAAVARRFEADVLHLGASDQTEGARTAVHAYGLLGRSVHDVEDLTAPQADYLFVGPVFDADPTDELQMPGLELVRRAAELQPVDDRQATPWFAVGGITAKNIEQVVEAGALRAAVSSAITAADDPETAAAGLKLVLQQAWDANPAMESYAIGSLGGGNARLLTDTAE